jgi:hypothetical protein
MSSYEEYRYKRFVLQYDKVKVTSVTEVLIGLKKLQDKGEKVSIVENTTEKTITFNISVGFAGTRPGVVKNGISAAEAVAFVTTITGTKNVIRQAAVGVHHALNEKNLQEAYNEVIKGVSTMKVKTPQEVHAMLIEFISVQLGETKTFNSEALNELFLALNKDIKKSDLSNHQAERADLLLHLYGVISQGLIATIASLGYNPTTFQEAAKNHHFVHYTAQGKYRLAKNSGEEGFKSLQKSKTSSALVNDGTITFDKHTPHLVFNSTPARATPASAGERHDFVINVRSGPGPRPEDLELKSAREFLADNHFRPETLKKMNRDEIKEQAKGMGWVFVPAAGAV